ncbi:MAG: hypothetical protein WAM60_20130, partial [Candidatus Promineifilaceae bacterium]
LEDHPEPTRGNRPEVEVLEIDRLQNVLSVASDRYSRALDQLEGARLATIQAEADVRQTYFVVDAPMVPSDPSISRRQLAVSGLIFVFVGVVIAAAAIVGGALLDRSLRFPMDVEQWLDLPVLALVPETRPIPLPKGLRKNKDVAAGSVDQKIGRPMTDEEPIEAAA